MQRNQLEPFVHNVKISSYTREAAGRGWLEHQSDSTDVILVIIDDILLQGTVSPQLKQAAEQPLPGQAVWPTAAIWAWSAMAEPFFLICLYPICVYSLYDILERSVVLDAASKVSAWGEQHIFKRNYEISVVQKIHIIHISK